MKKEREDRPYFDENKNYLDEDTVIVLPSFPQSIY